MAYKHDKCDLSETLGCSTGDVESDAGKLAEFEMRNLAFAIFKSEQPPP